MNCLFTKMKYKYLFSSLGFLLLSHGQLNAFEVKIARPEDKSLVAGQVMIISEYFRNKSSANGSYRYINELFEKTSNEIPETLLKIGFDVEYLKVQAYMESQWRQFDDDNTVHLEYNKSNDSYDIGIMQINNRTSTLNFMKWKMEKIKNDPEYNIKAGISVMENKYQYVLGAKNNPKRWKTWIKKYDVGNHSMLEITLKTYNGMRRSWEYLELINKTMAEKPWEKKVQAGLYIDKKQVDQRTVRRTDQYMFPWDTDGYTEDWHEIKSAATTETNSGLVKRADKIMVKKGEEKEEGYIRGQRYDPMYKADIIYEIKLKNTTLGEVYGGTEGKTVVSKKIKTDKKGNIIWGEGATCSVSGTAEINITINQGQSGSGAPAIRIVEKKITYTASPFAGILMRKNAPIGKGPDQEIYGKMFEWMGNLKNTDDVLMLILTPTGERPKYHIEMGGGGVYVGGQGSVGGRVMRMEGQLPIEYLIMPNIFVLKSMRNNTMILESNIDNKVGRVKASGIIKYK